MSGEWMGVRTSGGIVVASDVVEARSFAARFKGWMFRPAIGPDEALYLPRCASVHTCFMRTAIDAVFLDRAGKVIETRGNLAPWRMASCPGADAVLELPAGRFAALGLSAGDRLEIQGRPA